MFVYTATRFTGELGECAEGDLEWIEDGKIPELPLWEGDRVFLPWLDQERFFSGKFVYRAGRLVSHAENFF